MAVQWDIEFIESNVMRMTYQPRNGIGVKGILMEYDHPIPSDTCIVPFIERVHGSLRICRKPALKVPSCLSDPIDPVYRCLRHKAELPKTLSKSCSDLS